MDRFNELREQGRVTWLDRVEGWRAEPEEVMEALREDGFREYKREVLMSRRGRGPVGGVWQGLDMETGSVATAIWVNRPPAAEAIVFVEIDGEPLGARESQRR